jgi:hypothetical protein
VTQEISPLDISALRGRWQIACACIRKESRQVGIFRGFESSSGLIARCLGRFSERKRGISQDDQTVLLAKLWPGCVGDNPGLAAQLVHEIEFALARSPRALLAYLTASKSCTWRTGERQALLHLSLGWCNSDELRDEITSQLKATLVAYSASDGLEATPPGAYIPPSQRAVYEALLVRGEMFFSPKLHSLRIQPRLNPLIAGPTGVGKTFIVEAVAKRLDASFMKVCFGDWIPVGATEGVPTMKAIYRCLSQSSRVLLLLDELCKFRPEYNGGWTRSIASDLWQLLDRNPGTIDYADPALRDHDFRKLLSERLWIVGAGTWQDIQRPSASIGFSRGTETSLQDRIAADGRIPDELLLRFNPQIIQLRYPLQAETVEIYDHAGITALATAAGVTLNPAAHDWSRGGMRSLEDLATTLMLKLHQVVRPQTIGNS